MGWRGPHELRSKGHGYGDPGQDYTMGPGVAGGVDGRGRSQACVAS